MVFLSTNVGVFQTPRVLGAMHERARYTSPLLIIDQGQLTTSTYSLITGALAPDPTRVGRGSTWSAQRASWLRFRPHACGERDNNEEFGGWMFFQTPRVWGEATWHLRAWSWNRLIRLPA